VNNSKNLALKINKVSKSAENKESWSIMISNYVFAMKEHLRDGEN